VGGLYDIESFLDDVKTWCLANLNPAIQAVNSDKADAIVLKQVDVANGYFFQALNTGTPNADPFVLYGIETPRAEAVGQGLAQSYQAYVVVVVADPGNDRDIFRRLLRYQRALMEVFRMGYAEMSRGNTRPKISGLNPFPLSMVGMENAMAVGLSLAVTME
jgi:hypothetical protein